MRNKEFVCKVMGCSVARTGKLFTGQGLAAHYRMVHGNLDEGNRQISKQRKAMAMQTGKSKPMAALTEFPVMDEVRAFDETGEPTPDVKVGPTQSESPMEADIRQILEEHIGRIEGKLVDAQHRRDEADFELKRLQDELIRSKASLASYKLEEKVKHAGSTNDGGEYA